jgi:hypothetical protein
MVRLRGRRQGYLGLSRQRVGGRLIEITIHRKTKLSRKQRTRGCTLAFRTRSV